MFISYSNYIRSDTRSFEEKNEVKFKQDNKYQLKQFSTPENIPYILARRLGTPEKSTFLRSNKSVRLKMKTLNTAFISVSALWHSIVVNKQKNSNKYFQSGDHLYTRQQSTFNNSKKNPKKTSKLLIIININMINLYVPDLGVV